VKYIFIFLNNKLITCDTIVPFILDLKNRNPKLKIRFFTNDIKTLNVIRKNNNLIKIINLYGKITVIGWLEKSYSKLLRRTFKFIHIFQIILKSLIFKGINIHFRGLENFPFNLIYIFNKKNTFLFEANCWGYNSIVFKTDILFYPERNKPENALNSYNNLVAFSKTWPQVEYSKKKKRNLYLINSTRVSQNWLDNSIQESKLLIKEKPLWHNNKKSLIYILGSMDLIPTLNNKCTGASLLESSLKILLKKSNYTILIKPHAITDMKIVNEIILECNSNRIFIVYNHVSVLAQISTLAFANYFSYALVDAWVSGITVIEYSHYDDEALKITNNNSVENNFVDIFINNNPKLLELALLKKYPRKTRLINKSYQNDTDVLLDTLSKNN
jgi:hypothetical protein